LAFGNVKSLATTLDMTPREEQSVRVLCDVVREYVGDEDRITVDATVDLTMRNGIRSH
jgi:hypothetical protein